MKKIVLLMCIFLLCGCAENTYKKLGYDTETAKLIAALEEEDRTFFDEYSDFMKDVISDENFDAQKLDVYTQFKDLISGAKTVELVNAGKLEPDDLQRVKELVECEDFREERMEDYLHYAPRVPEEVLVRAVNNGLMKDYGKISKLCRDPFFVIDDLELYLEHYDEKEEIRDLVEYINTKAYLKPYEDVERADVEKYGYQVLVNKFHALDPDYEPDDLVDVEAGYGVGRLRKEAYESYKKMQEDAMKEGYSFYITSPYRSYDYQSKLYNKYLSSDSQANVDTYSARPGHSEHQLGLAVDILKQGYDFGNFYMTPEAQWLKDNAWKYGFIFRYPQEKVDITGYKYEAWHYRYVGDIAEDVYKSGVTYDEYFEKYIK